jgi:hypothetical protein
LHRDAASGPGLIDLVRDASSRIEGKRIIEDRGVPDKRCFVLFEEMENLFTSTGRQGSTLEKVWNMAWDGRTLENNAKMRQKATNPHVCCVSHITPESFQQAIKRASGGLGATNGFLNRWITIQARHERVLPWGGNLPNVADCVESIRQACAWLGSVNGGPPKRIAWHPDTHSEWGAFVCAMHSDHPFLRGIRPIAARLKPMITRVAMLFAVIDRQDQMTPDHLRAAKAFCLQSIDLARPLFIEGCKPARGNSLQDALLTAIHKGHNGRSAMHQALGKKKFKGQEIREALKDLTDKGVLAERTTTTEKGTVVPGWFPVENSSDRGGNESVDSGSEIVAEPMPSFQCEHQHFLARGAEMTLIEDTEAIGMDGIGVHVAGGQTCFLASYTDSATRDYRDLVDQLNRDRPGHRAVIVGDTPLLIDRKVMHLAASGTSAGWR